MSIVLIVDDSPVIRRVMSVTLERNGYEVALAEDGQEAIDMLDRLGTSVDMVFADISMPEMDGMTMLRQIRQNETLRHLPVVILTAIGKERDRIRALHEGANMVLTKPSSSQEIIATLKKLKLENLQFSKSV